MGYQEDIKKAYDLYTSGGMTPEQSTAYRGYIESGAMELPPGGSLEIAPAVNQIEETPTGKPVSANALESYKSGTMSPEDTILFESGLRSGSLYVPEELKEKGVIERAREFDITGAIKEIPGAISEAFTGAERMTPEVEALPDWTEMPEMNSFSMEAVKNVLGTMVADPNEAAQIIQANSPETKVRRDQQGNIIFKSAMDQQEYAIKPGFRASDIPRAITGMVVYGLGGRGRTMRGTAGRAAAVQTGIEASQEALGGEFDPEQIPLAAATELGGEALTRGIKGAAGRAYKGLTGIETPAEAARLSGAVGEAERLGITPLTTDVTPPTTFPGKVAQAVTERIPVVGTGPVRATQQQQRVEAIRNVMRQFGADEMAGASDEVMKDLLKKRGKDLTKYTGMKKEVIGRLSTETPVDVSRTIQSFDDEIASFQKVGTSESNAAADVLEEYKTAIQNKDLAGVERIREEFGKKLKSPDLSATRSQLEKSAGRIYKAINTDMGDFIKQQGEPRDFTKWKVANKKLSGMMGDLKVGSLKSVLQKGEATPETVKKMLFSQKPSEIKLLYKGLTPDGKKAAKIAVLQRAAEKSGGIDAMSTAKFYTNLNKLQKSTGVLFNQADKKVLRGLLKALKLTKQAEVAGVKPITGAELTGFAAPTYLTWMMGGSPAAGIAATAGIGLASRMYESKPVRNALLRLAAAKPGKEQELLNQLTKALQTTRQLQTIEEKEE